MSNYQNLHLYSYIYFYVEKGIVNYSGTSKVFVSTVLNVQNGT